MSLEAGCARYRGRMMNALEADEFRRLERRLRRCVDLRRPIETMQELQKIKEFAGDHPDYQQIFEDVRRDYAERWVHAFGTSWKADFLAVQPG